MRILHALFIFSIIILLSSCSKGKAEDRYSLGNIISASWTIITEQGFSALSGEAINVQINKSYRTPEDELQKKSTIRQRASDGSNDYNIIFEDMIQDERQNKARFEKDPLKD
jgi:maltodextrin utilization protein YvdJ